MSQSITHEDKKEYQFELNQQEDFSDDTSRTYEIERNSTSRSQEINSETRIQESQVNELDIMKSEQRTSYQQL
jgi:hypothetical protein